MRKPLFDVFRDAMMRKPTGTRKEALDHFLGKVKADPAYLDELALDYFERMSSSWAAREAPQGFTFGRTPESEQRIERTRQTRETNAGLTVVAGEEIDRRRKARAESAARSAGALADLKARIRDVVLLDLILPNGKALRDATGADCAKAGGFYAAVAKHLKPTQVVDKHLSEANLQDIKARYFQRNAARTA
jgi:hypothetical protein